MTESTHTPPDTQERAVRRDGRASQPILFRVLGGLALAALIVALYAVVQLTSGEEPVGASRGSFPAAPNGDVLPLGSGEPPRKGELAPDFTVPTLGGGTFSLSRHLATDGRPVFVNMWAEWCFPCRAEMPAIDAISREHPEVHFIGVVVRDQEAPARSFIEEFGITYEIGLDIDDRVEQDYFVWAMPSTYLIGSDGVIIDRVFGPMQEEKLEELIALAGS